MTEDDKLWEIENEAYLLAQQELEEEKFRDEVERQKQKILTKKPLLHRLSPWKITIKRR